MNKLFCPVNLDTNFVEPCIASSLDYWHEKYYPRILKENLKPHNLYVMPDVHKTEYQDLKKYFHRELGLILKSIILFQSKNIYIHNKCNLLIIFFLNILLLLLLLLLL